MKNKKTIGYLRPQEKNWVNTTVHNIIVCYNPLLVFFIDTTTSSISQRSIFPNADYLKTDKIHIRLLVVHEDDQHLDLTTLEGLYTEKYNSFEIFPISLSKMQQQLTELKLFYCWVYKEGILQYERNEAFQQLPLIEFAKKDCSTQVAQWFFHHPAIHSGLNEVLSIPKPDNNMTEKDQTPNNNAITNHTAPISIFINSSSPQ